MSRVAWLLAAVALGWATSAAASVGRIVGRGDRWLVVPNCPGPLCPGEGPVAAAQGRRLVWLSFDGVALERSQVSDDATTGKSAIVRESMQIPRFEASQLAGTGGLSRAAIIDYTVEELGRIFRPYDVEFVTARPASGTSYSSIVFGGSCESVVGMSGCGGIALLDCDESLPHNITFVFPAGLDYRDLAPTAAQESAHAFGLAHTLDDEEVMFPFLIPDFYPDHFGDGDAACPPEEIQDGSTCNRTSQNSHEEMLRIIGRRVLDLGEECVSAAECASGICGALDDERRCTQECSAAEACPAGFSCRGEACWPGDDGGCGCRSGGTGAAGLTLGLLALLARRGRRSSPASA